MIHVSTRIFTVAKKCMKEAYFFSLESDQKIPEDKRSSFAEKSPAFWQSRHVGDLEAVESP